MQVEEPPGTNLLILRQESSRSQQSTFPAEGAGDATTKSHHDNNLRGKYTVEKEDDKGQFQQVSGGFGDSNNVDEETI